ncbi:TetR/AcrR family transcriptional regulator [Kribbella sp. CA-294648]|uniref:TetR/AcrR family transcriptional regulator n=1 Tax=Kribbella sp. CA-294648 TaxID=3239948 RepID=UPI003D89E9B6
MPKRVDQGRRRREVAEALLRVVDAEGLDAASLPRIARELGATTGLIQQYFRSKSELLQFAVDHLSVVQRARAAEALEATPGDQVRDRLVAAMSVVGGVGDESGAEGRIWLAFLARAAVDPALRQIHVDGANEIREHCRLAFEYARSLGQVPPSLDAEAEARGLAAFADGLAAQRALEPELITPAEVRDHLDRYLQRIFLTEGSSP